jgi:hypothetical protein
VAEFHLDEGVALPDYAIAVEDEDVYGINKLGCEMKDIVLQPQMFSGRSFIVKKNYTHRR